MADTFDAVLAEIIQKWGYAEDRQVLLDRLSAAHAAEVGERDALLGQCYVIAGADTDGNPPERMAKFAVQAVTDLRRDYDEACDELHGPNRWKPRAKAAKRKLKGLIP